MQSAIGPLAHHHGFTIRQRTEACELFGYEGANKYDVFDRAGQRILFAAERSGGFWDGVTRQLTGHGPRSFAIDVVDNYGRPILYLNHPPRWFLKRIEVMSGHGRLVGVFEQCFTIFDKKLVVNDAHGRTRFVMDSSIFTPWDFAFLRAGSNQRVAYIQKTWGGLGREIFTDADAFDLRFESPSLDADERALLLAATIFIDLAWFEENANA